MPRSKHKKSSYLLLEIFIALVLVTLCLFPLIRPHTVIRNAKICQRENEKSLLLEEEALINLKVLLHTHQIPWEKLQLNYSFTGDSLHFKDENSEAIYSVHYTLSKQAESSPPSYTYYLLDATIELKPNNRVPPHRFSTALVVRKESKA